MSKLTFADQVVEKLVLHIKAKCKTTVHTGKDTLQRVAKLVEDTRPHWIEELKGLPRPIQLMATMSAEIEATAELTNELITDSDRSNQIQRN